MAIGIRSVSYALPEKVLSNDELADLYQDWSAEKILAKTGIARRHVAKEDECASDLAFLAAKKLFAQSDLTAGDVDFIVFMTQSPDYILPTSACILQDRLGIPPSAGAFDVNLGCSAYIYGLMLAKALVSGGMAKNVLLLTADTYARHIHPLDRSTRTIFGDAGAASWICDCAETSEIMEFDIGTDGSGYKNLIIPAGGMRRPRDGSTALEQEDGGSIRTDENLFMDGTEIFTFTARVVPQTIGNLLSKTGKTMMDIDLFIFHQANAYMLNYLRKKLKISEDKFYVDMEDIGNTVSATIPIALKRACDNGKIRRGDHVMLVGFGVGLSWGSTLVRYGGAL